MVSSKITEIFCSIDDFCKEFVPLYEQRLKGNGKKTDAAGIDIPFPRRVLVNKNS